MSPDSRAKVATVWDVFADPLVEVRLTLFPIIIVADKFYVLARHPFVKLERPSSDWLKIIGIFGDICSIV
jgi:hypothetical protein